MRASNSSSGWRSWGGMVMGSSFPLLRRGGEKVPIGVSGRATPEEPTMERKKASDFPPEVLKLFDGYVHGGISRREFLESAGRYAAGGFSAAAMLQALSPNFAWAQQVKPDDKRIAAEYVAYLAPQGSGKMRGYLARPAGGRRKLSAVVVIHENRGLNPYIEDVARRLATVGYLAFAPDALTPVGGYPGNEDQAPERFPKPGGPQRTADPGAARA